jgi:hypothetical protein
LIAWIFDRTLGQSFGKEMGYRAQERVVLLDQDKPRGNPLPFLAFVITQKHLHHETVSTAIMIRIAGYPQVNILPAQHLEAIVSLSLFRLATDPARSDIPLYERVMLLRTAEGIWVIVKLFDQDCPVLGLGKDQLVLPATCPHIEQS